MSDEYVHEVPYVRHFVGDLSPARLRLIAALNGVTPPPATDFDYCELGCAHGDTLAALAAAHPESRFVGVDISASHVASAKRLARDGALENVGILERDFATLVDEDIGTFDYIVAHGVLSWIGPEKRKALLEFARAKLNPGGLLHVSYNTMPGWAAIEPLRQLLVFGGASKAPMERAGRGVEFAHAMQQAGAEYFVRNPAASEMLETMTKAGLPYVAHEYLNEHWIPMYFAQVAWEMTSNDLHFVGGLPAHLNFPESAVPEAVERLLGTTTDRVTFESLKDFAVNEFFRRDVYVKGTMPRSADATNLYLDTTAWGTVTDVFPADHVVRLPHRTVELGDPLFASIFAALSRRATTLPALLDRPELAGMGLENLRAAMVRLIVADLVLPLQTPTRSSEHANARFRVPSVYNQTMLRRLSGDSAPVMVSTVAGTAFPISALEGLAIRALTEVAPAEHERWVSNLVDRSVMRIRVGERVLEDGAEQKRTILETIARVRDTRLAKLVELGILAPVS